MTLHLVALGANTGATPAANARVLLRAVGRIGGAVALSRAWATPAWPPGAGPDFVNAAAVIHAPIPPAAMLARLARVEARAGRVRDRRWGPRILDLDLVAAGQLVRPDPATVRRWIGLDADAQARDAPETLILPHPRLQDRAFVLGPLGDVAPRWRHPLTGRSVAAMWAALPGHARAAARPMPWPGV
ncbi:2-amino-4-hydroxy-6-hydroxymethyldihydropteridine diphosphokinase [Jannaschia sp. KMU-145]|uniref:2-amino-4-hydroxy-6- hydroxymethyldihydropteridine diphosphokinase n=1 Tax=Jannaschia halovivens TaxID=3388667 RepID=UPI00396B37CE